jgi:signal-transduction protein with cAMP-binding, CBS, and nucleotidyltransferase domain
MTRRTHIEATTTRGPVNVVHPHSPLVNLVARDAIGVAGVCTLAEAVEVMRSAAVSSLLVSEPSGIVTERDLARALGAGHSPDEPIATVATRHPVVVPGSDTVLEAAARMLNDEVRHLIVELPQQRLGVVSMRDVLAVLLAASQPQLWLTSLRIAIEDAPENWLG